MSASTHDIGGMSHVNVYRVAPEIEERLDSLAALTGRTKGELLLQAIENGLYDVEDYS